MSWDLSSFFGETTLPRVNFCWSKLISRVSQINLHTFSMYPKPSISRKTRECFTSELPVGQHFLSGWNSLYWSVTNSRKLTKDDSQMHLEGFEAITNVLGCFGMPLWYQSWSFGKFVERSRWAGIPPYLWVLSPPCFWDPNYSYLREMPFTSKWGVNHLN